MNRTDEGDETADGPEDDPGGRARMKGFDYVSPSSVEEATALLSRNKGDARALAGGTDLLIGIMAGTISPKLLVSLKDIPELRRIEKKKGGIQIGATCTIFEIENSPLIKGKYDILSQACGLIGSFQIRCRATIGGNFCNASPAADTAAPLLALGARTVLQGPEKEREIEGKDFFVGPGQTVLKEDEIIKAIWFPEEERGKGVYVKLGRRKAMEISIVGVAVYAIFDTGKKIKDVKIGLSSVAPTPIRALRAESLLIGLKPDNKLIERAAEITSEASDPITDIRASKEYRKEMVKVLTRRALADVLLSGNP
ncbi:MAG: xanthine dehydrogenase family protein subunit M [Thermodesulfobacteriota bacterium]